MLKTDINLHLFNLKQRYYRDIINNKRWMSVHLLYIELFGKVIELFKSSRKGIILGCEVIEGKLALGNNFRVISAMGPIYTGKIDSLHIEKDAVKVARTGQQVGLRISHFNKAKVGDQIECFKPGRSEVIKPWEPTGKIFRFQSS